MSISQDAAETIGLQALAWLASQEELLPVFMGATGSSEDDMRTRAVEPEFLGSVLEFITMDDAWVMAFCTENDLSFDIPLQARWALPGGAPVHWT